jgi:hypothetical protein
MEYGQPESFQMIANAGRPQPKGCGFSHQGVTPQPKGCGRLCFVTFTTFSFSLPILRLVIILALLLAGVEVQTITNYLLGGRCMRLVWLGTALMAAFLGGNSSLRAETVADDERIAQAGGGRPGPFGFPGWDSRSGNYDRSRRIEDKEAPAEKGKDGPAKKGPPWIWGGDAKDFKGKGGGKMPFADEKGKKGAPDKKSADWGDWKKKDGPGFGGGKKSAPWMEDKKKDTGSAKKDGKKTPPWAEDKKKDSLAKKAPAKKASPWEMSKGKDQKDWRKSPPTMQAKGKGYQFGGPWAAKGKGMMAFKGHFGGPWAGHGKGMMAFKGFSQHRRGGPAWGHTTAFHSKGKKSSCHGHQTHHRGGPAWASHGRHHGYQVHHRGAVHHRGGPAWGGFAHHRGAPVWATSYGRGGSKHPGFRAPARQSWTGHGGRGGPGFGGYGPWGYHPASYYGRGGYQYGPPAFRRGW